MPLSGPPVSQDLLGHSFLERAFDKMKEYGDAICLIDEVLDKEYTFNTVYKRSASIAVKLQKLGIGKNTIVSFLVDNSIESVSFQFGTWFSGATSNPVNQFLKADEIRICISVSEPKMIFCSNKYLKLVENAVKNIGWDVKIVLREKSSIYMSYDEFINEDISKFCVKIDDPVNHIPCVLFTSGTTGIPKGVQLRDEGMLISAMTLKYGVEIKRALLTSYMFWVSNLFTINRSVLEGIPTVMAAETEDAEDILKTITKYKPNLWFTSSPVLLEMCYLPNFHKYDISSMKFLYVGGCRTSKEHKNLILEKVFNNKNDVLLGCYGSTEGGFISMCEKGTNFVDSPEFDSIGRLVHGIELKIVDITTGKELKHGQDGEILIKSKSFMTGYMNKNYKNVDLDSDGWYHMGDIGHYDENGNLYFTSRLKEIIKYRGIQFAPVELETILYKHPDVVEACVVGKPHDIDEEWPTAFVIKKTNSSLSDKELHKMVDDAVADSKKLRGGIYFVSSFPRSAVGKVLKSELVKMLIAN